MSTSVGSEPAPVPTGQFDVAYVARVFHHINVDHHVPVLGELRRVLARHGTQFIFEHNPLNPVTTYASNHCPLDADATMSRARTLRRARTKRRFYAKFRGLRNFFPGLLRARRPLGAQYRVVARS